MKNIGFTLKDLTNKITVKFTPVCLPTAKKPYYLRTVHQRKLGIHDIARQAVVYNIPVSPKVIEDGMTAGFELIYYLVASGYTIETPVFDISVRIPGTYDGNEKTLPDGVSPRAKLKVNRALTKYLREMVEVEFEGTPELGSFITRAVDEKTGLASSVMTKGKILTIHGEAIKIEGEGSGDEQLGVFFRPEAGAAVKADVIAVNEFRTLKVLVPQELVSGESYRIVLETKASPKRSGSMLKQVREVSSGFMLTAA